MTVREKSLDLHVFAKIRWRENNPVYGNSLPSVYVYIPTFPMFLYVPFHFMQIFTPFFYALECFPPLLSTVVKFALLAIARQ